MRSRSTRQLSPTYSIMRFKAGASTSSPIIDQVEPSDDGAMSRKRRPRASRSQVQRKSSPVPLPPCSATTSGHGREPS